jgi:hypothetical protein
MLLVATRSSPIKAVRDCIRYSQQRETRQIASSARNHFCDAGIFLFRPNIW